MSAPEVSLRDMRVTDVEVVGEIERDLQPLTPWAERSFHEALERPDVYACRVACVGDRPVLVGYAVVSVTGPRGAAEADVQNLAVHRAHQRSGIGRALLADLFVIAAERGARDVFLDVRADNAPARALYEASGFTETGCRRGYYGTGHDGIVAHRPLSRAPTRTRQGAGRG